MPKLTCAGCGGTIDPNNEPFYEFYIGNRKLLAHARSDETYLMADRLECLKNGAKIEEAEIIIKGRNFREDPYMFRRVTSVSKVKLIEIIGNTEKELLEALNANLITPEEVRLQRMEANANA